jgi:hypothetical protein
VISSVTYKRAWDSLIRRQVIAIAAVASFPLVVIGTAVIGAWLFPEAVVPTLVCVAFAGYVIAANVAALRYYAWRCPACDRPFLRRGVFSRRSSGARCVHCGLARFTPGPGRPPPGATLFAYLAYRRRIADGRCGYCGYDLRAGHDRCPECGNDTPALEPLQVPTYGRSVSLSPAWSHDPETTLRLVRVDPIGRATLDHHGRRLSLAPDEPFAAPDGTTITLRSSNPSQQSAILSVEARVR